MYCGISTPVVCHPSKVEKRVRFPYPAPRFDFRKFYQLFRGRQPLPPIDFVARRAARGEPIFPYMAAQSAAETVGQKDESLILEHLYNQIRTYFERN